MKQKNMNSIADTPDVSVIIVSWNARRHLLRCLESLTNTAGGSSQEIIVVDNGSTDGSVELLRSQFPQVILIENDNNLGFARANNVGIRESKGHYLCLANSDIIIPEGCMDKLVGFMEENPDVGMAGPRILNPDGTLQPR